MMVSAGGLEMNMVFEGATALVVFCPTHKWLALEI